MVLESDVVVWVLKGEPGLVVECFDLSAACGADAPLVVVKTMGVLFPCLLRVSPWPLLVSVKLGVFPVCGWGWLRYGSSLTRSCVVCESLRV